jgi:small subunit ribosomal protein S18
MMKNNSNRQNNRNNNNNNNEQKHCYFCVNKNKVIDFKDVKILHKFMSHYARIVPGRRTGLCAKHQRAVTRAIKRARVMGMMPFVRK